MTVHAARNPPTSRRSALDTDVATFASLFGETIRDLKSAGPPPAELREAVSRAGLGKRHRPALLTVAASGPITVSELAKRLGLLTSTTSTIVGELSRAGLLERSEDDEDRRRTIVCLNDDFRGPMEAWLADALAPIREALGRLSAIERRHFMRGWQILHEQAARAACGKDQTTDGEQTGAEGC